jgi:hypothetical protein
MNHLEHAENITQVEERILLRHHVRAEVDVAVRIPYLLCTLVGYCAIFYILVLYFVPVRCLGFSVGTVVGVSVWAIGVLQCPERPYPLN